MTPQDPGARRRGTRPRTAILVVALVLALVLAFVLVVVRRLPRLRSARWQASGTGTSAADLAEHCAPAIVDTASSARGCGAD